MHKPINNYIPSPPSSKVTTDVQSFSSSIFSYVVCFLHADGQKDNAVRFAANGKGQDSAGPHRSTTVQGSLKATAIAFPIAVGNADWKTIVSMYFGS